jgi:quercetin dioxygenase-like cupin family protein
VSNSQMVVKSMDAPEETRRAADKGQVELVRLDEATVGRATFAPGWRWSEHVKPTAGTDLCQATHTGYVVSGRQAIRMADGSEIELGPGDAFLVGPGHDSWVVGDEPCVTIDFTGGTTFGGGQR